MQGWIFKLTLILASLCLYYTLQATPDQDTSAEALAKSGTASAVSSVGASAQAEALAKADSLFHLKQYTQSLERYQSLFKNKSYSPSMLLKMAYIQEGLGHLAQSMYYLNLYYLASQDPQALVKLEDVANKNKLEGYTASDASRMVTLLKEYYRPIIIALAALCSFFLALMSYQKLKRNQRPVTALVFLFFFLGLLFAHTYFGAQTHQGIISNPSTYLMEGPSAGSAVVSIVGEGHRLEILGKKDVWLKVKWSDRVVFLKETGILIL